MLSILTRLREAVSVSAMPQVQRGDSGKMTCPTCKGTGKINGNSMTCPKCKGTGKIAKATEADTTSFHSEGSGSDLIDLEGKGTDTLDSEATPDGDGDLDDGGTADTTPGDDDSTGTECQACDGTGKIDGVKCET